MDQCTQHTLDSYYEACLRNPGHTCEEQELFFMRECLPVIEQELCDYETYFREDGWLEVDMPDSVLDLRDKVDFVRSRRVELTKLLEV